MMRPAGAWRSYTCNRRQADRQKIRLLSNASQLSADWHFFEGYVLRHERFLWSGKLRSERQGGSTKYWALDSSRCPSAALLHAGPSECGVLELLEGARLDLGRCRLGREPALFARERILAEAFFLRGHLLQADLQQAG